MSNSLQEALEKAGLTSSPKPKKRKIKPKQGRQPMASEKHQRILCECCAKTAPDVECYKHNNPSLNANWLCIVCADLHSIPDETRQSHQSDFAMRGTFRRRYGKTKTFPKTGRPE